ncbi:DUF4260 domain-containing protein [Mesobacillus maritimus]|uniref:DUF4260 domain-containing protein n=1 Tax=Mesobacillus maritimus TaxID=1643336 RepID=UPI0020405755|nr:DUF4260 domain-containing protein [Mesobacillus maritimus]MCM3586732.1 DUF4260 domain-containing protein [Mesobacillus maritimus]MCM3668513.1 DUF4260 domain-containing protein [Mesobacillus maritimus]
MVKALLHIEGLFVLILSLTVYANQEFSWFLFIVLLFLPDLSMVGYLFSNKVGAFLYNTFHTYSLAIIVLILGSMLQNETIIAVGFILTAHIGMDRMLGYGLKYPTDFKDTHLNRI